MWKWLSNYFTACEWQDRAEEIHKDLGTDCDETSIKVIREMEAQGLQLGVEVVVVYGRIHGEKHMCLEMYGKNSPDKKGRPVYKLNGYRIDGTAYGNRMTHIWKAPYGQF